jgi:hypothetical protein
MDLAPTIASLVPRHRRKSCCVAEGLHQRAWIRDIQGALTPLAMVEYVDLWRRLHRTVVTFTDQPDRLHWRWTENGAYSAASCYSALFAGSIRAPHWELTWRSWAPLRTNFKIGAGPPLAWHGMACLITPRAFSATRPASPWSTCLWDALSRDRFGKIASAGATPEPTRPRPPTHSWTSGTLPLWPRQRLIGKASPRSSS